MVRPFDTAPASRTDRSIPEIVTETAIVIGIATATATGIVRLGGEAPLETAAGPLRLLRIVTSHRDLHAVAPGAPTDTDENGHETERGTGIATVTGTGTEIGIEIGTEIGIEIESGTATGTGTGTETGTGDGGTEAGPLLAASRRGEAHHGAASQEDAVQLDLLTGTIAGDLREGTEIVIEMMDWTRGLSGFLLLTRVRADIMVGVGHGLRTRGTAAIEIDHL